MSNDAALRILICRMSSLGDTVLTMPVACALREEFPNAHLTWVVEKQAASMIREHRALNEVIQLDTDWSKSFKGLRRAGQTLRQHNFDLMIDCEGTNRSGLLGWLTAIPKRFGFSGPHSSLLNRVFTNEQVTPVFDHLTDRSLELLIPLGIHSPKVRWHLPIPPSARTWARTWRRNSPHPKMAILDPGTSRISKHWDAENFARVSCHLRDAYQYQSIVCWTTETDLEFANQIVKHSRGSASLAPHTDLKHLSALIELSDLFISGALEPLHISVAIGTSTINLHGTTSDRNCSMYRQVTLQSGDDHDAFQIAGRGNPRSTRNRSILKPHVVTFEQVCNAIAEIESKQRLLRAC